MIDFRAAISAAVSSALATGEKFYTVEHVAHVARNFLPEGVATAYAEMMGRDIVGALERRANDVVFS